MVELVGEKLLLREASDEDIDELYYWKFEEKEQAAKNWNGPYIPEEKISREEYRKQWNHNIFSEIPGSLIIIANGKTIAYVGSYWVDQNTNWLETGIVIYNKNFWNGGYGFEAYKRWIDFLFSATDLHRLGMSTWSGNLRMIKVAEKVGMQEEARIRKARTVDGKYFDAIKMGVLREEWEEKVIPK
ncbi:Protein N-acetyltransferase, RimJ/RimL family [Salinibacillus kushneri]|uniref:Protein N-acetyltransferase, RimJ/RimL family n=1 Tax=Salinibacillus kushneri TaxID=237682 RepID=A0A1I0F4A8_9BACI|nr:GNAT family protein [Salinibacillus kushneri]SET52243.1 Protein N-acetyltransferase, RimJ/RimL family [Salinibacillus kushneri]